MDQAEWHYRLPAGNYYFEVKPIMVFGQQTSTTGEYVFAYRYEMQNDCNSFTDAGSTPATAVPGAMNNACTGRVWGNEFHSGPYRDTEDWYSLTLNQGESFTAYLVGYMDPTDGCGPTAAGISCGDLTTPTLTVELRNSKGALVPEATPGTATTPVQYSVQSTGTYFLRVAGTMDDIYDLTMSTSVAVPNVGTLTNLSDSCASPDAGNSSASAALIGSSLQSCYGTLGSPDSDRTDWYKFDVAGASDAVPQTLNFQMDGDSLSGASFEIIDPQNIAFPVGSNVSSGSSLGIPGYAYNVPITKSGTYKLRIFFNEFQLAMTHYEFTLDVRNLVAVPSIPPSIPPVPGTDVLNNDTCFYPGTNDAGNDRAHAAQLSTANPYCYGALNRTAGDTVDFYKFDATAGDKFYFMLSGDGSLDPNIEIRRPNNSLWGDYAQGSGYVPDYAAGSNLDATGTWSVKITPATAGSAGSYLFMFYWSNLTSNIGVPSNLPTAIPTIPNIGVNVLTDDCFGTGDAGNTMKTARPISNQTMCQGTLATTAANDVYDWYSFQGTAGQSVTVGVTGDHSLDPNITLFTPKGQRVLNYANKNPVPDYVRHDMTQTGKYTVAVTRSNPAAGHYGLMVYVATVSGVPFVPSSIPSVMPTVPSLSGDCGRGGDAPNRTQRDIRRQPAQDYNPNNSCVGSLGGADKEDWYQFGATAGQKLNLSLGSQYTLDADVWLIDPRGIWRFKSANGGLTPDYAYNFITDVTGTWKIRIAAAYGSGDYSLSSSIANY